MYRVLQIEYNYKKCNDLVPMAFLSFKSCSTKALEDSERDPPIVTAAAGLSPQAKETIVPAMEVRKN